MNSYDNLFNGREQARLKHYTESSINDSNTFKYNELGNIEYSGLPILMKRDKDELIVNFSQDTHALIVGATRSGKTTGYIIPTILTLAKKKDKVSMVVSDPKGELYKQTANMLEQEGYKILMVNFRDHMHSKNWNPLIPIYHKYNKAMLLKDDISKKVENDNDGKIFYIYQDKKFETLKEVNEAVERDKMILIDESFNLIDELVRIFCTVESQRDPYWEQAAGEVLKAIIIGMLEDSINSDIGKKNITEHNFSFSTILKITQSFSMNADDSGDNGFFESRKNESLAKKLGMSSLTSNATNTRKCILNVLSVKLSIFRETTCRCITSCNNLELDELANDNRPVALFIIYKDEVKVGYELIKLLISSAYTKLIDIANQKDNLKLDRAFYFILDEFGSIPRINDFEITVSACGGRNIWFVLVLQSYEQLYRTYGENCGNIILDNLNTHIYFGSNSSKTKIAFSEECGKTTIISPLCVYNNDEDEITKYTYEEVRLVPVSKLNKLDPGDCIITQVNEDYVLWSHFERSYMCKELEISRADISMFKTEINYFDKKYDYKFIYKKAENPFSW